MAGLAVSLQWTKVGGLPLDWVRSIAINPTSPEEILVALQKLGIYRSADGGATWTAVYGIRQSRSPNARQVAFAPSNANIAYATVQNDVLVSVDRGRTWTNIRLPVSGAGGWALAIDPTNADHVYVGINANAQYHVYESLNRGQQWNAKNLSAGTDEGIISLAIDPANPKTIFAGGNTDVADHTPYTRLWKSTNGGSSWVLLQSGLPNSKRITDISINPCVPGQVWIARQKHGLVDFFIRRSNDAGLSWGLILLPAVAPPMNDEIGISPTSPCSVYADMRKSTDGGASWQDITYNFLLLLPLGQKAWYSAWAPDPWNNVLWLGTREHGLYFIRGVVP